jgi:hypothetical protein
LPFEASDIRSLAALVLTGVPDRPAQATDDGLWSIIRRGLEKGQAERQPSAAALAASLRSWLGGGPPAVREAPDLHEPEFGPSFDALVKRGFS